MMDCERSIGRLYQYASRHQFEEFDALLALLEEEQPFEAMWEAYLMRAQIKLFSTDITLWDDLERVAQIKKKPQYACLNSVWECDIPNRFVVFPRESGALQMFCQTLPQTRSMMVRWYGVQGDNMVSIIQCNILYFMGDIQSSLSLSEASLSLSYGSDLDTLLFSINCFRCYLALGMPEKAERSIIQAIRLSAKHPECVAAYLCFRDWVNLTTNWSGDSPRFIENDQGMKLPVLDDRIESIRTGMARTTAMESAFIAYAERYYENAYGIRQHFMDVFNAIYWHAMRDYAQAEVFYGKMENTLTTTGLLMPGIECGGQILPLLKYAQSSITTAHNKLLAALMDKAQEYENALGAYQSAGE